MKLFSFLRRKPSTSIAVTEPDWLELRCRADLEKELALNPPSVEGRHAQVAEFVAHQLEKVTKRVAVVGSVRRGRVEPNDVDILAIVTKHRDAFIRKIEQIADDERSIESVGHGYRLLVGGVKVDVILSEPEAWGLNLIYFTGPRAFGERVKERAKRRGFTLSQSGGILREKEGGYGSYFVPAFDGYSEGAILERLGLEEFNSPRSRENFS